MSEVPSYIAVMCYLGLAISMMAFLPIYTKKLKITYIIPLLLLGAVLYLVESPLPWPDPLWNFKVGTIVSEVIVIISLMTAGLKIGVRYSKNDWKKPLLLLLVTMPIFVIVIFMIAHYILQINGPLSLLLAAVLAPTDPVLASEIQLKEHKTSSNKNKGFRYILTAEAGLNDGLAFPLVFLAILWSQATSFDTIDWVHFFSFYVMYKIVIGLLIGGLIGFIVSKLIYTHNIEQQATIIKGFLALSLTFFSYGLGEMLHSYGFLSVFATGIFLRIRKPEAPEKNSDHKILNYIEETEKFLVSLWVIFFGGALLSGILSFTNWQGVVLALLTVLVIRPVTGYLGVFKLKESFTKKSIISFLGVKGIGSFFYLSYAVKNGNFYDYKPLFGIVSYVVLFSIIIHGLTSIRLVDYLTQKEKKL